jgi:hypothetical protein
MSIRHSLCFSGHKQVESEGKKKDIPCKWKPKENRIAVLITDKI